jgi:hypothetical protein
MKFDNFDSKRKYFYNISVISFDDPDKEILLRPLDGKERKQNNFYKSSFIHTRLRSRHCAKSQR